MKSVYLQEAVRKAHERDGKSKRQIVRELGIHRDTVTRLLNVQGGEPHKFQRQEWTCPVLGAYKAVIEAWLKADEAAPRKQRHKAKRIYERLRDEHDFSGSERRVRAYVAELRQKQPEVFLPLAFAPGEMAQVDWAEVTVWLAGIPTKLQLFGLVLNYSGGFYCEAFHRANQEAFFEGHARAFAFLGGVPNTITYDNLTSAVKKILEGKNREENGVIAENGKKHPLRLGNGLEGPEVALADRQ